jgi:hypothetical protein
MEVQESCHQDAEVRRKGNYICFVDANHAGNKVTRRSHTGIIICVQECSDAFGTAKGRIQWKLLLWK